MSTAVRHELPPRQRTARRPRSRGSSWWIPPNATFRPHTRPRGAFDGAGIVADGRPLRRLPRIPGREAFVRLYKPPAGHIAPPRKGPTVAATPAGQAVKRLVVLVSGSGTNLQALLDEIERTGAESYGARIVAVGADRDGIEGLA